MSLLETKNKKFNLPFVFIAGVIFLIGLAYFANYLENLLSERIVEKEQKSTNEKIVTIRVAENLDVYLDSIKIEASQLEEKLKIQFEGHANPKILLQIEEGVLVEKTTYIMETASDNKYKVILEVRPK